MPNAAQRRNLERVDMLERRIVHDTRDQRAPWIGAEQVNFLRLSCVEDELSNGVTRRVELGDADAQETLAGRNREVQ